MSEEKEGVEGSFTNEILQEREETPNSGEKPINTMQDTIKEMGEIIYKKYPNASSNLTTENVNGMTRIDVLNEYNDVNFGYTFKSLTVLTKSKGERALAVKGFGIDKITKMVEAIHASFSQEQIPDSFWARLKGAR